LNLLAASLLAVVPAVDAMSLGGGAGWYSGEVSKAKNDYDNPWRFGAPAWQFKLIDPSGSLLSALSTASGNYGRRLGAQQRAEESARNGGDGTATYEVKTSVNATGSTQTFELLWAHDGSFESQEDAGWKTDDAPDLMVLDGAITANLGAWNGIAGLDALSLVASLKGEMGYLDVAADLGTGYERKETEAWVLFPFSLAAVYDAPLGLSARAFAGYDPLTGLVSIWSKNVHQAWEWGAGAEWSPKPWLTAEAALTNQTTNLSDDYVWAFATTVATFGARIDFDGF